MYFILKILIAAIEKGSKYDPDIVNQYALKSMGIDPGVGFFSIWYCSYPMG